jgi:hypothetical protein
MFCKYLKLFETSSLKLCLNDEGGMTYKTFEIGMEVDASFENKIF